MDGARKEERETTQRKKRWIELEKERSRNRERKRERRKEKERETESQIQAPLGKHHQLLEGVPGVQ